MDREIAESIRKIAGKDGSAIMNGTVISVDVTTYTCEVEPINGDANFLDVRLQSVNEGSKGIFIVPAIGSVVTIIQLTEELAVVANTSTIDSVMYKNNIEFAIDDKQANLSISPIELLIDKSGMKIASQSSDLLTELNNIIANLESFYDATTALTVVCAAPGSPSTPPVNVAQFIAGKAQLLPIKQQLKTFLQ